MLCGFGEANSDLKAPLACESFSHCTFRLELFVPQRASKGSCRSLELLQLSFAVKRSIKSSAVMTLSKNDPTKSKASTCSNMDIPKSENGWPKSELGGRQVVEVTEDNTIDEMLGTTHDQRGMIRMGKKQELRRNFQFFSIWGFAVLLGCSWEYVFMSVAIFVGFHGVWCPTDQYLTATASYRCPMGVPQGAYGCS